MIKMVDSVLFEQEWFMDLDLFHRLLYIYLLTRTTNSGMFDVNCRRMSFDMGRKVTEQDIFRTYGNRIVQIPGHPSKGIFPSYISFCWTKGRDFDPEKNRVVKGIVRELAMYGMTIKAVEELSTRQIVPVQAPADDMPAVGSLDTGEAPAIDVDVGAMFDKFWSQYPARRDGRPKNLAKFTRIIMGSRDPKGEFIKIMNGLQGWRSCRKWTKDDHAYVDSMSKFLNNRLWETEPDNAGANANANTDNGQRARRAENAVRCEGSDLAGSF